MGLAEVVPGVSGGTIAFVTGIYDELIRTLAGFNFASVRQALTNPVDFWRDHNLSFLAVLGLGMVVSIGLFANLIRQALEQTPTLVWGFFFGLIAMSVVVLGRERSPRLLLSAGVTGVVLGYLMTLLTPGEIEGGHLAFFFGGVVAVCAWILPAVSGSFLLLVLGLYPSVLIAISEFQVSLLCALVAGCAIGILLFTKLLEWLLGRYSELIFALLTGFMLGAMVKLWPWRIDDELYLPAQWQQLTSEPALPVATVVVMVGGGLMLWLLTHLKK
jgi:putative membrane protein